MSLKTTNKEIIREVPWGMLVWQCETGEFAADQDGSLMYVFLDDRNPVRLQRASSALTDAAKSYGFPDGKPVFLSGRRPVSDEELEHQLARADAGLVPDPLDIAAINHEAKAMRMENDRG
jgi:hypothetical protein